MESLKFFSCFSLIFSVITIIKCSEVQPKTTRFILVGATGDLARKYLWQGIFNLYQDLEDPKNQMKVYAASRVEPEVGQKLVQEMTKSSIKCSKETCEKRKADFIGALTYHKLKTESDYKSFCEGLNEEGAGSEGRIFYLSVPPSAYGAISKNIHSHCRSTENKGFLRVVFEKPFGEDLPSAKKLAKTLAEYFKEEEMYRIDHYLGKKGVQQIIRFRHDFQTPFEPLWNKDHIDRVEIVLKEKGDCHGRTSFYNQYGVIRDVMQNHMTELMAMVAMEIPRSLNNVSDIARNKIKVLKEINPLCQHNTVLGQYSEYRNHCSEDKCTDEKGSKTPTFAAVKMYVDSARWHGVPFIFISGKQLDERAAYVRIIFKNNEYSAKSVEKETCNINQIVFHIQGGMLGVPALILSKKLPGVSSFLDWKHMIADSKVLYNCQGTDFQIFTPVSNPDAYSALIQGVYHARHDLFISTEGLLASWEAWTPLLDEIKSSTPRFYGQDGLDVLDFSVNGKVIRFSSDVQIEDGSVPLIPLQFRGEPLVTGSLSYVISSLATTIKEIASQAVTHRGVFHISLSGGSSPLPLFKQLAFFSPTFPWHMTHIWIVDERCVPLNDSESNFNSIYQNLIKYTTIPFLNIHPMPVYQLHGLCHASDKGPEFYEKQLKSLLQKDEGIDFVLLGVGSDGHTASIFPNSPSTVDKSELVVFSEATEMKPKGRRMTLTLNVLNKAKSVAVLIHGEKKADIVRKISEGESSATLPITLLDPTSGEVIWYIDDKAMINNKSSNLHSEL